ncbi:MAG: hypothetical protein ACTSRH_11860 [Promethearchaeota archaeon]
MNDRKTIKCPVCKNEFIPRTFYPENAIFTSTDGRKIYAGFDGYISAGGIKPNEVILGYWITYCPNCNYIMRFVKEIIKKERVPVHSIDNKLEIREKYNNYYFGFEFGDYSQHLKNYTEKIQAKIEKILEELQFRAWEKLHSIKDHFKFLVKFFAILEDYCDNIRKMNKADGLVNKIKNLKLPSSLEEILLQLNNVKDEIIKGDYELSIEECEMIDAILVKFILYLIDFHIKPIISSGIKFKGVNLVDLRDIKKEVKNFITTYLYSTFNSDKISSKLIRNYLENWLSEEIH